MAVAPFSTIWSSRIDGGDPTDPPGSQNTAFAGSAGSADGKNWKINSSTGSGYYSLTPTTTAYTMFIGISYTNASDLPADGTVLAELDNGTKKVQLQADGTATGLKLVGATTQSFGDLDLTRTEIDSLPTSVRITLDATGNAKAYLFEIIEGDDGNDLSLAVAGSSGSSATAKWGNDDGEVTWHTTYLCTAGAFNPDEISIADYTTQTLIQTAFSVIETLKDSSRFHLKSVDSGSIYYGYDLSSQMMTRTVLPAIVVLVERIDSPDMYALAGVAAEYTFNVRIMVVTKGIDYKNAYRQGLDLVGEIMDELYAKTGLKASVDSLTAHQTRLDSRMDPDEQISIHDISLTYMKRIDLHRRSP